MRVCVCVCVGVYVCVCMCECECICVCMPIYILLTYVYIFFHHRIHFSPAHLSNAPPTTTASHRTNMRLPSHNRGLHLRRVHFVHAMGGLGLLHR